MKLKLYNLVIIATIFSCAKTLEERSEFDGCLETYLDLKVKFPNEPIHEQTTPECYDITTVFEELQTNSGDVTDTNKCIEKGMAMSPALVFYLPLQVMILQSSDIKFPSEIFTPLMKYTWISASLKCVKNEEINDIFDVAGIPNVMISTAEEKYCFAKYAQDKGFFQSNYVELNPSGLLIVDIDCNAIIAEKREQFSVGKFIPHFIFRYRSIWNVLNYIEIPKETKDTEITSFKDKITIEWPNTSEDDLTSLAALEYHRNKVYMRVVRRSLRDTLDPFDMPDERFREMYRFPRSLALDFLNLINGKMMKNPCPGIPMTVQFCEVLNFYASGSYQRRLGSDAFACMSQSKVSKCIESYSFFITTKLMDRFVTFPKNINETKRR